MTKHHESFNQIRTVAAVANGSIQMCASALNSVHLYIIFLQLFSTTIHQVQLKMNACMNRTKPFTSCSRASVRPVTVSRPCSTVARVQQRRVAVFAASPEEEVGETFTPEVSSLEAEAEEEYNSRGRRGPSEAKLEFKHFLPLPKPAHLIFIKPTVAVVAGLASRSSVGLRMTAGGKQLERYVIEYYSKSVKN